eukprot:COSAG01_NODE_41_length_32446_cov_41.218877_37_plen_118_part_00
MDQSGFLDEEEISALLLKMGRKLSKSERKRAMADMKQQQDDGGRKDQGKGAAVEVNYAEFRAWYMEQDVGQLPCGCHTACAASCDGLCVTVHQAGARGGPRLALVLSLFTLFTLLLC